MNNMFFSALSHYHFGAVMALIASFCWTFAPFLFASAVRSMGAYYANLLRLVMASVGLWGIAFIAIAVTPEITRGINAESVFWMVSSGVTGLVVGDYFYFSALKHLGPRRTLQILTSVPIVSALEGMVFLGERLSLYANLGIMLTVAAILCVNWFDKNEKTTAEPGSFSYLGVVLAVAGAVCHGTAAVLMRKAYLSAGELNILTATAVRISSAGCVMLAVSLISGKISGAAKAVSSAKAFGRLAGGTVFGPVLGMLFYMASLKFAPAGIASTMSSLSPVLIVPISAWWYKTGLNKPALIAMAVAVVGVVLIFSK